MLQGIRKKLSFANVVSVIALSVALGGGAYAAATINSADIVNNSVRSIDIKNRGVKSKDIKNNTVKGIDVAERSLAAVCPSNAPNLKANVCFGPQQPGLGADGDWDVAARDCASENLRLPTIGEALLVTNAVNTGDTYIWTDELGTEAGTRVIIRTNDAGFTRIATAPKGGPRPYRCVTTAR